MTIAAALVRSMLITALLASHSRWSWSRCLELRTLGCGRGVRMATCLDSWERLSTAYMAPELRVLLPYPCRPHASLSAFCDHGRTLTRPAT